MDSEQPAELTADQTTTEPTDNSKASKIGSIPRRWKLLNGSTNWKDMLNPLDDDLRRYIIQYGEKAMATYEAFNAENWSKYTGACRYPENELFDRAGLVLGNPFQYNITKYIYATASVGHTGPSPFLYTSLHKDAFMKRSNWIGYIAASTDEGKAALGRRDILVAWRGTVQLAEWFKDADSVFVRPGGDLFRGAEGIMLHRGFRSLYVDSNKDVKYAKKSAREQVLTEIRRLVQVYKDEETTITVTGHSLGAALATINAVDIIASKAHRVSFDEPPRNLPVTAFLFATPNVGNVYFREYTRKLRVKILRVRNVRDVVPAVPPVGLGYVPVGEELKVDSLMSDYLNNPGDMTLWHDLEVYLHLVAGTQGLFKELKFGSVKRGIALVNKYSNGLKPHYLVPPYWKVSLNKNMVQQPDGSWKLDDKPYIPVNENIVDDGSSSV